MKKTIISLVFLLLLGFSFTSFKNKDFDYFVPFKTPNDKSNKCFVSKYELTNANYKLFLDEVENEFGQDAIKKLIPNGENWEKVFEYQYSSGKPFKEFYFTHPAYGSYPVVNLNKESIEQYCKWLTNQYNTMEKREYTEVIFRLPTEKEWLIFAAPIPGNNLPWHGDKPCKAKGDYNVEYCGNLKIMDYSKGTFDYTLDGALNNFKVGHYLPNKLGLYDIIGNVAEYTSDGKIKGGSWDNTIEESTVDKEQSYNVSDPRVGFRLVMEVIKE